MPDAIFARDGDAFVPTERACSPWGAGLLHGGPAAGLLARAIENARPSPGMMVVRLTIDLFRPVPQEPLRVRVDTVRTGRRIHVCDATLFAGETAVSRATGLLLQPAEVGLPESARLGGMPPPGPGGLPSRTGLGGDSGPRFPGFHSTVEVRHVAGGSGGGTSTAWVRIPCDFVEGEETSPLVRVAATADFANGISHIRTDSDRMGFINTDITLYLHRPAVGEWICLGAHSGAEPYGIGIIETTIHDEQGPVARALQALLANPRAGG